MRAIIRVKTNLENERIGNILEKSGWLPKVQSKPLFDIRRDDILAMVHKDDFEIVNETLLPYIMLEESTKTWGIVTRTADNLTIRLKNPNLNQLKIAVEKLLLDLQKTATNDPNIFLEFFQR